MTCTGSSKSVYVCLQCITLCKYGSQFLLQHKVTHHETAACKVLGFQIRVGLRQQNVDDRFSTYLFSCFFWPFLHRHFRLTALDPTGIRIVASLGCSSGIFFSPWIQGALIFEKSGRPFYWAPTSKIGTENEIEKK